MVIAKQIYRGFNLELRRADVGMLGGWYWGSGVNWHGPYESDTKAMDAVDRYIRNNSQHVPYVKG